MKNPFHDARFAALSLGCVVLSFFSFAVFVYTGVNHRLGSGMDKVGRFAVLSPALIAVILALASLIWNRRKAPGLVCLILALIAAGLLYCMGG